MKRQELLNLLNESADSISLHDGSLIDFKRQGSTLTFLFCLGEYHYLTNRLEKYIDNLKNNLILSLTFNNIKNLKVDLDNDFQIDGCEIISNDNTDNLYALKLLDGPYYGNISFSYEKYSWNAIEELNRSKLKVWCKNYKPKKQ